MLLKLEMPLINPSLRGGHVLEWTKGEGETFEFGDEICVVAIDQFAAIRKSGRATLLSGKRNKALRAGPEVRVGKVYLAVALSSSDCGLIRRIVAGVGDAIVVGDLLAVVSTPDAGEYDPPTDDWAGASAMRVVANVVDHDEVDADQEENI